MKKDFHAPGGIFIYPFKTENDTEVELVLRPGDQVTINGISVTVTIEYIDALYSIVHRSELNDEYYMKGLDVMFEKSKIRKNYEKVGFVDNPLEGLCSRDKYFTIQLNHGKKIVLKRGEQTRRLAPAVAAVERIKKRLSPKDLDLYYSIYGCEMKQTEYAEQKGLKKTAANNRVVRFNEKFKKMLAEEGIDEDYFG